MYKERKAIVRIESVKVLFSVKSCSHDFSFNKLSQAIDFANKVGSEYVSATFGDVYKRYSVSTDKTQKDIVFDIYSEL